MRLSLPSLLGILIGFWWEGGSESPIRGEKLDAVQVCRKHARGITNTRVIQGTVIVPLALKDDSGKRRRL